jgi:4-hydroxy-tetrahydrodipicolinate reductase
VALVLRERSGVEVEGPFARAERAQALTSGADVVLIATTSFLADIAPDIREALEGGSNVLTSAEEAAFPWAVDESLADELDELARAHTLTVLGAGVNPGLAFDGLVLALSGAAPNLEYVRVERVVDLSGFGSTVLSRIGVGYTPEEFAQGVERGSITGHIGFPQSMRIVAARVGKTLAAIEREIEPQFLSADAKAGGSMIAAGRSGGFIQRYRGVVDGRVWFDADFTGHIDLAAMEIEPRDEVWIQGSNPLHMTISPGFNAQRSSAAAIANSIQRVIDAPPGWLTVAELPPAAPWE